MVQMNFFILRYNSVPLKGIAPMPMVVLENVKWITEKVNESIIWQIRYGHKTVTKLHGDMKSEDLSAVVY